MYNTQDSIFFELFFKRSLREAEEETLSVPEIFVRTSIIFA